MSLREDVELYTKLSGEDGSQETIATIGAYLRGYDQGKEDAEPHWIPVTEDTLPEEGRIVVVYGEKGTWDYGKYRGYGPNIHYWYWKNKTFKKVYWWMYKEDALPEPYKGER